MFRAGVGKRPPEAIYKELFAVSAAFSVGAIIWSCHHKGSQYIRLIRAKIIGVLQPSEHLLLFDDLSPCLKNV